MGLEKHPVLVSVLVSKKLSGLGLGLGLEACGLDYNTGTETGALHHGKAIHFQISLCFRSHLWP